MNDEKTNVFILLDKAKKDYYGPNFRELSKKRQEHLFRIVLEHDKQAKTAEPVKKKDTNGSEPA